MGGGGHGQSGGRARHRATLHALVHSRVLARRLVPRVQALEVGAGSLCSIRVAWHAECPMAGAIRIDARARGRVDTSPEVLRRQRLHETRTRSASATPIGGMSFAAL